MARRRATGVVLLFVLLWYNDTRPGWSTREVLTVRMALSIPAKRRLMKVAVSALLIAASVLIMVSGCESSDPWQGGNRDHIITH